MGFGPSCHIMTPHIKMGTPLLLQDDMISQLVLWYG